MIKEELLLKYQMLPLEDYKKIPIFGNESQAEITFYQMFLQQTDHIPIKIVEKLLEDLADATLLNFIEVFLKFIISVRTEYKEVLQARKYAREKINELESQSTAPTE